VVAASTVGGEPDECAEKIRALLEAGCDSVILNAVPAEATRARLRLTAAEVLPRGRVLNRVRITRLGG